MKSWIQEDIRITDINPGTVGNVSNARAVHEHEMTSTTELIEEEVQSNWKGTSDQLTRMIRPEEFQDIRDIHVDEEEVIVHLKTALTHILDACRPPIEGFDSQKSLKAQQAADLMLFRATKKDLNMTTNYFHEESMVTTCLEIEYNNQESKHFKSSSVKIAIAFSSLIGHQWVRCAVEKMEEKEMELEVRKMEKEWIESVD